MSLDYLRPATDFHARREALEAQIMAHQMERVIQRAEGPLDIVTYPSTVVHVMGDGQPLVEACTLDDTNGTRRFLSVDAVLTVNGQPMEKLQSIPDTSPDDEDDSAQDRRYAIDVAHEQGQSTVYVMATSVGEVKRNMRQKAGYVVLAIRLHGEVAK